MSQAEPTEEFEFTDVELAITTLMGARVFALSKGSNEDGLYLIRMQGMDNTITNYQLSEAALSHLRGLIDSALLAGLTV